MHWKEVIKWNIQLFRVDLVHLITKQINNPESDFKECLQNLFAFEENETKDKPLVLWSCYYSIPNTNNLDLQSGVPDNVFVCSGPDLDLDYDTAVDKAKAMFGEIYPGAEFLPRAPDPEDIIFEADDEEKPKAEEIQIVENAEEAVSEAR